MTWFLLIPLIYMHQPLHAESKACHPGGTQKIPIAACISDEQLKIEECWRQHLLEAAKRKVAADFPHAPKGLCSGGVQASLGEAGFLPSKAPKPEAPYKGNLGYWNGDAIDFHDRGPSVRYKLNKADPFYKMGMSLEPGQGLAFDLGFRNLIQTYPNDRKCLPGTLLVYASGIEKNEVSYQKTGEINRNKRYRLGDTVGHVTICGDSKNDKGNINAYYTDGKTTDPALKRRRLVGVYTMSDCKFCQPSVKKLCQKISRREEYE